MAVRELRFHGSEGALKLRRSDLSWPVNSRVSLGCEGVTLPWPVKVFLSPRARRLELSMAVNWRLPFHTCNLSMPVELARIPAYVWSSMSKEKFEERACTQYCNVSSYQFTFITL